MPTMSPSEGAAQVGRWSTTSAWRTLDQARIDAFAEITEDHQFIHVDPTAAAATPFGGTIAHGFLTLSLLSAMAMEGVIALEGMTMGVNYGFEKVRFLQPVRSGQRIRGRFALKDLRRRGPGEYLLAYAVTVEIEGEDRPALVAEWLTLQLVDGEGPRP